MKLQHIEYVQNSIRVVSLMNIGVGRFSLVYCALVVLSRVVGPFLYKKLLPRASCSFLTDGALALGYHTGGCICLYIMPLSMLHNLVSS